MNFNKVKHYFGALHEPLKHVFEISLIDTVFPNNSKITGVMPIFKCGNPKNVRAIIGYFVLLWLSKILKRIMYNNL